MKYNIIRSRRRTVCINISSENVITVRCPVKMRESEVNKFVESKIDWINKVLLANKLKADKNRSVLEYREIYIAGERLPLIISDKNVILDNAVFVKSISDVKKTFIKHFSVQFIKYAKNISEQVNLKAEEFAVKAYKSRWGCCDRYGKITFNYLLFMLPVQLQTYVIVHELCHTVHFNHTKDFWRLVGSILPDYANLRRCLRSFDFITKLY